MEAHSTFRRANGREVRFFHYGDPEGEPVLFCHGWPGSGLQGSFADLSARARGFRIASPDRPGIGGSDYAPGRVVADWPELVEELAAELGWKEFRALAISGGCPYALAAAAALPERVRAVAIGCGAAEPELVLDPAIAFPVYLALATLYRKWPALLGLGFRLARLYTKAVPASAALLPTVPFLPPPDRRAVLAKRNRLVMGRSVAEAFRQPIRGILRDATRYLEPWKTPFEGVRCPVRFWHGDLDRNIPIQATRTTAAKVPGAAFDTVPGEGHYSLPLERMDLIVDGLRAL